MPTLHATLTDHYIRIHHEDIRRPNGDAARREFVPQFGTGILNVELQEGDDMSMIEAVELTKTYRVAQKKEGVLGALRGLYRREYREVRAVDQISFRIEPGEMVAFLGPNGAGKTTTLKMLSGLIYPTAGEARVLGFVPWQRADAFRRQFALVMGQKNQLWWDLPAADSFQLLREIYAIPPAEFRADARRADRASWAWRS